MRTRDALHVALLVDAFAVFIGRTPTSSVDQSETQDCAQLTGTTLQNARTSAATFRIHRIFPLPAFDERLTISSRKNWVVLRNSSGASIFKCKHDCFLLAKNRDSTH